MATRPSSNHYLPAEAPIKVFDERIRKLEDLVKQNNVDLSQEIERQVDELGVNYLLSYLFLGAMTLEEALRSLALFSREVMPRLAQL